MTALALAIVAFFLAGSSTSLPISLLLIVIGVGFAYLSSRYRF